FARASSRAFAKRKFASQNLFSNRRHQLARRLDAFTPWPARGPPSRLSRPAVGKHLQGLGFVGRIDLRNLLELAHTLGGFGAEQVPFAGVHAEQFSCGCQLEALGGPAVGFEFSLWLRRVAWHC